MKSINWDNGMIGWEWAVAIGFLLLLLLFYVEVKKGRKRRLELRLLFLFFMVTSLVLIALNPAKRTVKATTSAVLLTEDYSVRVLDSLQKLYESPLQIFTHETREQEMGTAISGLDQIAEQYPEVAQLFIVGNAIAGFGEEAQYPFKIIPLLNKLLDGIAAIDFTDEVQVNEPIRIRGQFRNTSDSSISLLLIAPHGVVDSLSLSAGVSAFSFTASPKLAGKFLYKLVEKRADKGVERKYILPIVVKPFQALNIVIHAHAPTFEIRALKNWLGESGHQLAVRSQLSKGIYHQEFINHSNSFSFAISEENLKKLDVMIFEGVVFSGLAQSQLSILEKAVVENGLGLIILGDQEIINRRNTARLKPFVGFGLEAHASEEQLLEKAINEKNIQGKIQKLPYQFTELPDAHLYLDGLFASSSFGLGKTAFSLSTATHLLALGGKKDLYSRYWSTALNAVLPEHSYQAAWKIVEKINFVNSEVNFDLVNHPNVPQATVLDDDSAALTPPMLQNVHLPGQWHGKLWPSSTGWYKIKANQASVPGNQKPVEKWFYAQSDSSWKTLLLAQARKEMQAYSRHFDTEIADKSPVYTYVAIERIYFFAIFLLSCGLLWIEQKY